ncbi:MAG: histidine phosphatase family protein [Acidobacteriota bacterium]
MIERLIVVRHGETVHNLRGIAQGWSDSELSETGLVQVGKAAERLVTLSPTAVYSSSLPRAVTTAESIAGALGLNMIVLDELREMNCGRWEGLPFLSVRRDEPEYFARWSADPAVPCPEGESHTDVRARITKALQRVELDSDGAPSSPVLVSHGTAIRIAATVLLGLPLECARQFAQDNAAINIFDRRGGAYILERWNDVTHWREGKG